MYSENRLILSIITMQRHLSHIIDEFVLIIKKLKTAQPLFTTATFLLLSSQTQGRIQDFLRGGSEHRGVSLKQGVWGAQPPRSYRVFYYYNTKTMLIIRYRAYLSKYRKYLSKYGVGGVVGATPWKI